MSMETAVPTQRRDRWSSWAVVALAVVALLLGWAVKAAAEGRTSVYETNGMTIRYPAGWVKVKADPPVILQVEKLVSPARTTLTLQRRPVATGTANPLNAAHQALGLERGRSWTAYRVLSVDPSTAVRGRDALQVTFAYVETSPNPFLTVAPVVMLGQEYLFMVGDSVQVVTMTAAEANYERSLKDLKTFLASSPK